MSNPDLSSLLYELGRYAGLFSLGLLSFLIISGDLARLMDRFFGLDRIIKLQRKASLAFGIALLLHPLFFILSSGRISAYLIPDFIYLPLAIGILAFYFLLAYALASKFYKHVSYRAWQYLHILSYLLFFAAFYHAREWGSSASEPIFKLIHASIFLLVLISIAYRSAIKLRLRRQGPAHIAKISDLDADHFEVLIDPAKSWDFRAGQFAFLRLDGLGLHARHPFTIASRPGKKQLRFVIKDSGRFTETLRTQTASSPIWLDGPFGRFYIRDGRRDIIMIAGGVGITPFLSMLDAEANNPSKRRIHLFYGAENEESLLDKTWLDTLELESFDKTYCLSRAEKPGNYHRGRIDIGVIEKETPYFHEALIFICGPEPMKDSIHKQLLAAGARRKNILTESFFW